MTGVQTCALPILLLDFQMRREAYRARWDPKASQESRASPPWTPARRELTESQGSEVPQGSRDHLAQTVSGGKLKGGRASVQTKEPGPGWIFTWDFLVNNCVH